MTPGNAANSKSDFIFATLIYSLYNEKWFSVNSAAPGRADSLFDIQTMR